MNLVSAILAAVEKLCLDPQSIPDGRDTGIGSSLKISDPVSYSERVGLHKAAVHAWTKLANQIDCELGIPEESRHGASGCFVKLVDSRSRSRGNSSAKSLIACMRYRPSSHIGSWSCSGRFMAASESWPCRISWARCTILLCGSDCVIRNDFERYRHADLKL